VPPAFRPRFCFNCGQTLAEPPPTYCQHCGQRHFLNPKPCGEAVVIEAGRVLMLRRAREPWKGGWDVPGGFCDGGEHPMHAAERELEEELGIEAQAIAYAGTWIDTYGPPALDGIQEYTVNSAYLMAPRAPVADLRLQPEEVLEAGWFDFDALPEPLGFPDHLRPMLRAAAGLHGKPTEPLADRIW
jgi:ADP-ribose pyrophosphatase YjhB (NUDIX family)